jgi:DMSO/TMAO reductase YedYZ heme-binding membrane subunit
MDITFYDITVYLGILGLLMMIFSFLTGMRIWKSKKRMIYHKRIGIVGFIAAMVHGFTMLYYFFFS